MDFTEAFDKWVEMLQAEELWKLGNKTPLEHLLDQPMMMEALRTPTPSEEV